MIYTKILLIIGLLFLSAFFSASEIAFNASNKIRLKKAADAGEKTAKAALYIADHYTSALCTILVGNNLVNIGASSVSTVIVMTLLAGIDKNADGLASVIATAVMTVIILIFGEIVPKIVGRQHADTLSRTVAFPIRILSVLLFPIVILVLGVIRLLQKLWKSADTEEEPTMTEDELSTLIDTVQEEGVIDEEKSELLQSTLEFPETTVEEVMTPRIDTEFINLADSPEEIKKQIDESRYSRLPVYDGDIDEIMGILFLNQYYKAILDEEGDSLSRTGIEDILITPCLLHKTMKLPNALNMLREKKTHLGIVIDEFGGTMGVVTIEDILEELVGDIWDENEDAVPEIVQTGDNTYDVNGDMNLDDLFDALDFTPEEDFSCDYSTVGGWAVEMTEANPHVGDSFTYNRITAVITEMDDVRVTKLTVLLAEKPEEDE